MMTRTLLLVTLLTSGMLSAAQAKPIIGADISHLPQLEAAGATFYDHDAKLPEDLLQILKRNGVNRIRLKVWNEPGKYAEFPSDQSGPEGYNNPAHVVAMAKRAEAAGLPRWTVIFFGTMTRSSTRGTQARAGVGPLPPLPVKRLWGGMIMGALRGSRISSVSGIISG